MCNFRALTDPRNPLSVETFRFIGSDADGDRVECCTVHEIDPINGTALVGRSLTRLPTETAEQQTSSLPTVTTSHVDIVAEVRGCSGDVGVDEPSFAVHVVNWTNLTAASVSAAGRSSPANVLDNDEGTLSVTLVNADLFPQCADCIACPWNVTAWPLDAARRDDDGSESAAANVSCRNNVTTIQIDTPTVWTVITVQQQATGSRA